MFDEFGITNFTPKSLLACEAACYWFLERSSVMEFALNSRVMKPLPQTLHLRRRS